MRNPNTAPQKSSEPISEPTVLDERTARRFRFAQWRVLLATMLCYVFYYTGRHTFGFAIPGIIEELKISETTLGWASAVLLWSYAIGQSVNGNLGDKYGGRRMMSSGAILSCGLNWVVSFGTSVPTIFFPWAANGYVQSMGWAPGSRVLSNWWEYSKRARVYGAYLFAAGMSTVLAYTTAALILEFELGWRWIFRLPVLLLLIGGITYYFVVRDYPSDLGFPPLRDNDEESGSQSKSDDGLTSQSSWERYRQVLSNRRFLIASVGIGFQSVARYGLVVWVPVHFLGKNWKHSPDKWISIALPIGMALGALTSGWLSDRFFQSNRSRVIGIFMLLAAGFSLSMFILPTGHPLVVPMLFLTGFFVYGPQSAFWALCPDLLGTKQAGTATGIMNTFAYAFAGFGEVLIGWWIATSGQTGSVFAIVAASCLTSAAIAPFIRK